MINNQNIGVLSEKVARLESDVKTLALPSVTSSDAGKSPVVNSSGAWEAANIDADNVTLSEGVSVKDGIDALATFKEVWSGSVYSANDTFTITDFATTKKYLAVFKAFTGANYTNSFMFLGSQANLQFAFWGSSTQFARYRIDKQANNSFKITNDSTGTETGNALIAIYEI